MFKFFSWLPLTFWIFQFFLNSIDNTSIDYFYTISLSFSPNAQEFNFALIFFFIQKKSESSESSSLSPLLKSITLNMKIKFTSNNQLIHPIIYGLSLARSQSLVMHHLILTLSKRCNSLPLINWRLLQWQSVTWFQTPSQSISLVINASVYQLKKRI